LKEVGQQYPGDLCAPGQKDDSHNTRQYAV
jgi:hypothetical protein